MTIYNEMFQVRKEIQQYKKRLNDLTEASKTKGSPSIHEEIEEVTQKLEHLKVRMCILEKLTGNFTH